MKFKTIFFTILIIILFTSTAFASGPGIICGDQINLHSGPSLNSEPLALLYYGNNINIHGACGEWYEVDYNGITGYIYGSYVIPSETQIIYTLTVDENVLIAAEPVEPEPITTGEKIVNTALKYLGTPYVWGGESLEEGGFDCSGLVNAVYKENGYDIERVAQSIVSNGNDVPLNSLQPGDILLFGESIYNIWHVAIYIGNGNCIHAPYGEYVKIQSLDTIENMWLIAARRII